MTKRVRRKRGRPPRDYRDDPDLVVAELAIALQAVWDLSERAAIDLALAWHQSESAEPSKILRGAKAGLLVGYETAPAGCVHQWARVSLTDERG